MSNYTETTGSVARRLSRSASRVLQLHQDGHLDAIRDSSGRRLFSKESVERYLTTKNGSAKAA